MVAAAVTRPGLAKACRLALAGAALSLAACSGGSAQLVDEWRMETNTKTQACALGLHADQSFIQNCNGRNIQRGTWALDGQSVRFVHEAGMTTVCGEAFDGSVLVLTGGQCQFPGRYQRKADYYRDHPS
ncbi:MULTISPECIES: hypothetical protein [unclassified Devosia]|uniref:hypothetical protein n=1 Tax=unclassified Devosia TaxID=196773 RepID=UPI0008699B72|nr:MULTISPECIES: hypothetical protein [unclassified Devosia]MBN9361780.1 hypothetical protein [Devosia sp.]ODS87603.1 MAG: hypothetical protein ABS47_11735 [Devosia sp. SCN 66-27]OJX26806.1 MAG: hypothetical protein BGO83_23480 [Devosia sp. 66-14]